MDHAGGVQRAQPAHELGQAFAQPRLVVAIAAVGARPGPHVLEEVVALDQLHREEPAVLVANQLAEGDQVVMRDGLEDAELAFEAGECVRIGVAEGLERHAFATLTVERFEHLSHPASPQSATDLETLGQGLAGDDHPTS